MTILAIVASIAAPEYWRMKDRDDYRSEGQALFDTILDARNAALTSRLCNDDSSAVRWMIFIDTDTVPAEYEIRCYRDATNFTVEKASLALDRSEIELIDFNETALPAAMDGTVGNPFPDDTRISFFSGGVNGRLEYDDGSINKADSVLMTIGHISTAYQHTICFNRVSGFPTFNKTGDTCQDY